MKVTKRRKAIHLHNAAPGTPLCKSGDTTGQVYIATNHYVRGETGVVSLHDGALSLWPDLTPVVVLNAETIVHGDVYEQDQA